MDKVLLHQFLSWFILVCLFLISFFDGCHDRCFHGYAKQKLSVNKIPTVKIVP